MSLFYTFVGFIGMEVASWLIHRFLMHGPLWFIHKTHHTKKSAPFELNDLFSLFFGSIAIYLIVIGSTDLTASFWIGIGISTYGMSYFILHDILIHRRLKMGNWPKKGYLRWMISAHQAHHKTMQKNGSESFGLFIFDKKFKVRDHEQL